MNSKPKLCISSADQYGAHQIARQLIDEHHDCFSRIFVGGEDRGLMRDLEGQNVEICQYDLNSKQELQKFAQNCDVFLLIPPMSQNMRQGTQNIIEACRNARVRNVLFESIMEADRSKHETVREFAEWEKQFKQAKFDRWCIVRLNLVMQTFLVYSNHVQQTQTIPMSAGDSKFAPVDLRDVAEFCANVMAGKRKNSNEPFITDSHHEKCYNLTGPEALDGNEIADRASRALGTRLKYESVKRQEVEQILRQSGQLHDNKIKLILDMFEMIRENQLNKTTKDYERVVGEQPRKVEEFFSDHSRDFKPGRGSQQL